MRYFIHDLETNKLHIHTGGKSDWLSLPRDDQDRIKRSCLWSPSRNCWVSRALAPVARANLGSTLARLGFEDRGTSGEKVSFAEKLEAKQERAEARADRMEAREEKAQQEASSRFNSHNVETLRGLQGEPVKVGHHSEKRHRNLIERADNDMRKGCEAMDKAKHYAGRAEAARSTAEGKQYSNPAFLGRRIKEQEAEERLLLRRLEGKQYEDSLPKPISEEYRTRLLSLLEDVRDKLGFYRHCLETCGKTTYDRESLKGKTEVFIRGQWREILKLNPTTVAVPGIGCTEEICKKWPMKYPYLEVKNAR